MDLHTQVNAALRVKAVFFFFSWQQLPSADSGGWYFEEQAGERKGRIKRQC